MLVRRCFVIKVLCACCMLPWPVAASATPSCPPPEPSLAQLRAARASGWAGADAPAEATALALVGCLASPDPEWRDALAFEALQHWMREGPAAPDAWRALRDRLLPWLEQPPDPAAGFAAPFAALVLAEVARTDRMAPWMQPAERDALVTAAADYLASVRDYRGFDAQYGWRHGVAHGADFVLQLVLNPALDRRQLDPLLAAVAAQVAPAVHAYVHGEPGRLAAPVLFAARRDWMSAADWDAWVGSLGAHDAGAADAPASSEAALSRRHNLQAFLLVLYAQLQEGSDPGARERLLPAVREALRRG